MKSMSTKHFFIVLILLLAACASDEGDKIGENGASCFDGILNGDEITIDCGGICDGFCPLESIGILNGEVVGNLQLDPAITYRLTGPYLIRDKGSLAIPAGTVIKADPGIGAYIAVTQGGQLFVTGQPDNPVIITSGSENPAAGDWGGIVVCGQAPINGDALGRTDIIDILYGGTEQEDTSGVFNYFRIEYAGAEINDQKFDAIAFYGVGQTTTITRIQTYESKGNGMRFVGGSANTKWIAATGSGENAIAIANNWSGKGEYWHLSGSSKSGIAISSDTENSGLTAIDTLNNISILGPTMQGGIDYKSGNSTFEITNLYTSYLNLGINIANGLPTTNVDLGNFTIDSVAFDNPSANFIPTNYTGENQSFFTEAITSGSGNNAAKPDWAMGWTIGID